MPEVYGLSKSTLVTFLPLSSVPAGLQPVTDQAIVLLNTPPQYFEQLSTGSAAAFDLLRQGIAPLAAGNGQANQGIDILSAALDQAVTSLHPLVSPADVTVLQFDQFVRSTEVH